MTIAFIGTGNMGGAIVRGLIKSGTCLPEEIICTAKTQATLDKIRGYNACIRTTTNNSEAVAEADIVVLAVKPWLINQVMEEIHPKLKLNKQIIVSVAAGVTLKDLAEMAGNDSTFFRVIPNTAVEALCGVTFIAHQGASQEQVDEVQRLFATLGYALVVDEKLIPAGTALASCGIAFAMRYIRAAMAGGVELGFRPEEAARIVEHTVKGAATLLLESCEHPEVAIDRVTTAGGITIKGLNAMEESGFTTAVIDGLKASMV
ncbi:MAG: pyrroline-5-carboxylate reductase [Bacteroidaceae bacterium]|nr:pyrroline-5-carboxylate reductase [Bacteroidaceae bacterium]